MLRLNFTATLHLTYFITITLRSAVFLALLTPSSLQAQWYINGVVVCDTSANGGIEPLSKIASDGAGGAFICWRDIRNGNYDIYAQHLDSTGTVTWQRNGIATVTDSAPQDFPRITADGKGGVFVAWEDSRSLSNSHVYAHRLTRDGGALWQANGVKAAEASGLFISIAKDERNGLLLGWVKGGIYDVVVQRLDSLGTRMWGDSGVQVTNRPGNVSSNDVAIVSDGSGGAIVAWAEAGGVYAQRVDSISSFVWPTNGVLLSDSNLTAFGVAISSDTNRGAIINWNYTDGSGATQRIDNAGQIKWSSTGVTLPISTTGGVQRNNADGSGGAYIGSGRNIQHFDSLGNKLWGPNGTSYYDTLGSVNSKQVSERVQGVFNFAETNTPGEGSYITAQWIDIAGQRRFGAKGIRVTPWLTTGDQNWPSATSDGRGGAIVCWSDYRSLYPVIYAARVDTEGLVVGVPREGSFLPHGPRLDQNYPNPFNPSTEIRYALRETGFTSLKVFDVIGREVTTLVDELKRPGEYSVRFDSRDIPTGVYFYRLISGRISQIRKMILIR